MILIMIFQAMGNLKEDQEHDQDHEQEGARFQD
jgi:hypothetical protein